MVEPVPLEVIVPGYCVSVQVPKTGKPLNATLPEGNKQVGGVIVPTIGAAGITGCGDIIILADDDEIQPAELVTV